MDNEKTLAEVLVQKLIEMTCRAVKAEDELTEAKTFQDIFSKSCDVKDAKIDALQKEVEQLRAKLNSMEGLEASDRGLL